MKNRHAKSHKKYVKKKKFNLALILPLFLVFIMVASMFGYVMLQPSDEVNEYKKYKFTSTNEGYISKINGNQYVFRYLPQDVKNLNISESKLNLLKSESVIYITYDSDYKNAQLFGMLQYQLEQDLSKNKKTVVRGLINPEGTQLPKINCNEDIKGVIISFETPDTVFDTFNNEISQENSNCIRISSYNDYEFFAYSDRILYEVLGIYD